MGGLVAREYNQRFSKEDGIEVLDICTLGSPLDGTLIANLSPLLPASKCAKQMQKSSRCVQEQQEKAASAEEKTCYLHIASRCDFLIQPVISATMGNASEKRMQVEWLDGTGHISLLFSDRAADLIINYLQASK